MQLNGDFGGDTLSIDFTITIKMIDSNGHQIEGNKEQHFINIQINSFEAYERTSFICLRLEQNKIKLS